MAPNWVCPQLGLIRNNACFLLEKKTLSNIRAAFIVFLLCNWNLTLTNHTNRILRCLIPWLTWAILVSMILLFSVCSPPSSFASYNPLELWTELGRLLPLDPWIFSFSTNWHSQVYTLIRRRNLSSLEFVWHWVQAIHLPS